MEKEMSPDLHKAIIGILTSVRKDNQTHQYYFGQTNFGHDITLPRIMRDQADIGWLNFFSGQWSLKWREAQKSHYLGMNKKKSTRLWVVAVLKKKMMMICWDL